MSQTTLFYAVRFLAWKSAGVKVSCLSPPSPTQSKHLPHHPHQKFIPSTQQIAKHSRTYRADKFPPLQRKRRRKKSSLLFLEITLSKNSAALAWKGCRRRTMNRANTQNYCKIRKAKFSVYPMYCIPSHSFSNLIKDLHGNAPLQNCNLFKKEKVVRWCAKMLNM